MTQRDEDYQTLATAINTLLYSIGYKQYFNFSITQNGIVLTCSRGKMESIHTEVDSVLPSYDVHETINIKDMMSRAKNDAAAAVIVKSNPLRVKRILPQGHYKHHQNGAELEPELTYYWKEASGSEPFCLQLTLGNHYRRKPFEDLIDAINEKSCTNMVTTYLKPQTDAFELADYIISGLVNPRYAERLVNRLETQIAEQTARLEILKKELAARRNPNGIGWGDRMLDEKGGKGAVR